MELHDQFAFIERAEDIQSRLLDLLDSGNKVFLLTDTNCLDLCWPRIGQHPALGDLYIIEVDPGESSKELDICTQIWTNLNEEGADRQSIMICLGGGVVTDLGGFIAAVYKRGIKTIHIPTTLVGMVDAALGGKTGVNLDLAKNQIGTFSPEITTWICPEFLETLPDAELLSGYAEMYKHGVIVGGRTFEQIRAISNLREETLSLVKESAMVKAEIVKQDPFEKGVRKYLNYGHTFGHAIESVFLDSDSKLSHGHAVAIGMMVANCIAQRKGLQSDTTCVELNAQLKKLYSLPSLNEDTIERCWQFMAADKKNEGGKVLFVLCKNPGQLDYGIDCTLEDLKSGIDLLKMQING